jgi:hypothetical protein
MEPERLAAGLLDATLPQPEWTHRGHIGAAHWLIHEHGRERALVLIRDAIPRLNDAHGVPNTDDDGYHETLTVFFACAVADCVARDLDVEATLAALPSSAPLEWWSEDVLMAPAARRAWVEPDRARPPFALVP